MVKISGMCDDKSILDSLGKIETRFRFRDRIDTDNN